MVKQFFKKILCLALGLSILVPQVVYATKSSPAVLLRNKNHFEPEQSAGDKFQNLDRGEFTERQADALATAWQTTEFTYDILNKLKTVKDPLNRVTTYNYDNNENLASVVDAELNTTSYVYDERDLLFTITDANTPAGVTTYDYDLNGNLAKITWNLGRRRPQDALHVWRQRLHPSAGPVRDFGQESGQFLDARRGQRGAAPV